MPNRILRDSICVSDTIDGLGWFDEVFFYRLIVNCDDFGRADARAAILKASLFPLKDIRVSDIEKSLNALSAAGLVYRYSVNGRPYLQLVTWEKYQQIRNKRSKFPAPDEGEPMDDNITFENGCYQMKSNAPVIQSNPILSKSESEKETESESKRGAETSTPAQEQNYVISLILNDKSLFGITQDDIDHWGELYPAVDVLQELKKMQGWVESNPTKRKTRKGIKRFITSWLSRTQDKGGASYGLAGNFAQSTGKQPQFGNVL